MSSSGMRRVMTAETPRGTIDPSIRETGCTAGGRMDGLAVLSRIFSGRHSPEAEAAAMAAVSRLDRGLAGGVSPLAAAFSFSLEPDWISFACSEPVLRRFPPEISDVFEIAERMASEKAYDDIGDPPSFWDCAAESFHRAMTRLFSSHARELLSCEASRGPFIARWIDEKWIRRSASQSSVPPEEPALAGALAMARMISMGAAMPRGNWKWAECLSRAACGQAAMDDLAMAMADAGWMDRKLLDGRPSPLHLFTSSTSSAGHGFVHACRSLESMAPGSVLVRDHLNRTPLFFINARICSMTAECVSRNLVDAFRMLCELGGDPSSIVAPVHPREAANHPEILSIVERSCLEGGVCENEWAASAPCASV